MAYVHDPAPLLSVGPSARAAGCSRVSEDRVDSAVAAIRAWGGFCGRIIHGVCGKSMMEM